MYHGDGNEHRRSRPSASQSFLPPFELGPPVYFQWVRKLCTTQNQATGLHGSLFSPISDTRGPSAHWLADINIYPQAINHGLLEFPSIQLDDFPGETSTAWPRGFFSLCDDTLWGIPNGTAGGWTKAKGAGRRAKISASDGKIWHEAFVALKPYYPPLIKHGLLDNHPFRSFTSFFLYTVYIVFSFNPPFIRPFPACHVFFFFRRVSRKKEKQKNLCALENEESGAQIGLEEEHTKQEGGGLWGERCSWTPRKMLKIEGKGSEWLSIMGEGSSPQRPQRYRNHELWMVSATARNCWRHVCWRRRPETTRVLPAEGVGSHCWPKLSTHFFHLQFGIAMEHGPFSWMIYLLKWWLFIANCEITRGYPP